MPLPTRKKDQKNVKKQQTKQSPKTKPLILSWPGSIYQPSLFTKPFFLLLRRLPQKFNTRSFFRKRNHDHSWVTDHERCKGGHCSTTLAFCAFFLSDTTYLLYNRPTTTTKQTNPAMPKPRSFPLFPGENRSPRPYSCEDKGGNLTETSLVCWFSLAWFGMVWFGSSGLSRFPGRRFKGTDGTDGTGMGKKDGSTAWDGMGTAMHGSDLDSGLSLFLSIPFSLFFLVSFVPPHHRGCGAFGVRARTVRV
jgi:hypothetical protein